MKILEEISNKAGVLKLEGRFDALSSKDFKKTISAMINKGIKYFILDMSDVDFIDSSGLGSLVSCLRLVNKEEGDIMLASLQDPVRAILELTRLYRVFNIYDDCDTAIKNI